MVNFCWENDMKYRNTSPLIHFSQSGFLALLKLLLLSLILVSINELLNPLEQSSCDNLARNFTLGPILLINSLMSLFWSKVNALPSIWCSMKKALNYDFPKNFKMMIIRLRLQYLTHGYMMFFFYKFKFRVLFILFSIRYKIILNIA